MRDVESSSGLKALLESVALILTLEIKTTDGDGAACNIVSSSPSFPPISRAHMSPVAPPPWAL